MTQARPLLFAFMVTALIPACKKEDETPPPQQPAGYGQQPAYGQQPGYQQPQQQPGYQQPQQQPQQQQPGYQQQPQQQPGQPAPAGTISTPGSMALPCTSDANCLSHRCNTQVGKCAWPCQSNNDCNPGFQCISPACVPAMGGAPPAH